MTELIPPLPPTYRIYLASTNRLLAWTANKTEPVLWLDESQMKWVNLDDRIQEVAYARKKD